MSEDEEEFRNDILEALFGIRKQLERISEALAILPHNIAHAQGYKKEARGLSDEIPQDHK
jgi:hypothetical protein